MKVGVYDTTTYKDIYANYAELTAKPFNIYKNLKSLTILFLCGIASCCLSVNLKVLAIFKWCLFYSILDLLAFCLFAICLFYCFSNIRCFITFRRGLK